jgi:hypothetical protein
MPRPRRNVDMTAGEFGDRAILDADLSLDRLPPPGAPSWTEVAEFALTFDGYQYRGHGLGEWANDHVSRFKHDGRLDAGLALPDLRALLFYEQRRYRHLESTPEGPAAALVVLRRTAARRGWSPGPRPPAGQCWTERQLVDAFRR